MKLSRRDFLTISAAVLGSGWSFTAQTDSGGPVNLTPLSEKIGEHYLSLYPKERELPRLKATLHFLSGGDSASIKAALARDIHGDFTQGHMFRYQGWVLSRTEGRLCAYKFLTG